MGVGTQGTLSICRLPGFSLALLGPNDIPRGWVPKKPRCQMVGHGGSHSGSHVSLASPDCCRPIAQATNGLHCRVCYMLRRHTGHRDA